MLQQAIIKELKKGKNCESTRENESNWNEENGKSNEEKDANKNKEGGIQLQARIQWYAP